MESYLPQTAGAIVVGITAACGVGVGIMVIRIAGALARLVEGER